MLQLIKKVSQNRTKLQQTNNKRPFFLQKINKVFLRPILQNLKGRSSRRAESDAIKQQILSFREVGQKRKIVVKTEFTLTAKLFPLKRVLKK